MGCFGTEESAAKRTLESLPPPADEPHVATRTGQAVPPAIFAASKPLRYVARQPIFDRNEKVFGYELLFRDGLENSFQGDPDQASRATLDRSPSDLRRDRGPGIPVRMGGETSLARAP